MYYQLFYQVYNFSVYLHSLRPKLDRFGYSIMATVLISVFQMSNFISVGRLLNINCITTTFLLDVVLLGIIILSLNALIFLRKGRYKQIIKDYESGIIRVSTVKYVLIVIYFIISFVLFIKTNTIS